MAAQHPKLGPPGITYTRQRDVVVGTAPVPGRPGMQAEFLTDCDCLTYRNRKGALIGILSRWPMEVVLGDMVLERRGAVSLWVHPRRRRRGIGMRLLAEADRRWPIDWSSQLYTEAGHALVTKYLETKEQR